MEKEKKEFVNGKKRKKTLISLRLEPVSTSIRVM